MNMLRVLVGIPHFFSVVIQPDLFHGSYAVQNRAKRLEIIAQSLNSYKEVFSELDIDGKILLFGDPNNALIKPDIDVSNEVQNSLHIPWKAIDYLAKIVKDYDFVIIAEDDIYVSTETISELLKLENELDMSKTIIPNRVEFFENQAFCVDLLNAYRWKTKSIVIRGEEYRQPLNTHSGFLLLSTSKFIHAYDRRRHDFPTKIGALGYLESALANLTDSMSVFRKIPVNCSLPVTHLDGWLVRQIAEKNITYETARKLVYFSNSKGKNYYFWVLYKKPLDMILKKLIYLIKSIFHRNRK